MPDSDTLAPEAKLAHDRRVAARVLADAARVVDEPATPEAPSETRFDAVCQKCAAPFSGIEVKLFGCAIRSLYCPPCVEAHNTPAPAKVSDREAEWARLCPVEYRTEAEGGSTNPARLARECSVLPLVTGWQRGSRGLLVGGETGRGKTRAMWRLLRRLFNEGVRFRALTAGEFGRGFADACGSYTRNEWFTALATVPVLFLDDLGKSQWTGGVWGEFFEMVETRVKNGLPLLVTTNETGTSLGLKCEDEITWEPLYRRLCDYCERISA